MRIVCPSCGAAYAVPDAAIAGRRAMRCARCAHEFASPAAAEVPAVAQVLLHEDPPIDVQEAAAVAQTGVTQALKMQVLAAWGASLLVLVILTGVGITWRRPVMQAWPASARVYGVLGLLK